MKFNPFGFIKNLFSPKDQKALHPASERVVYVDGFPTIATAGGDLSTVSYPGRNQAYLTVSELWTVISRIARDCAAIDIQLFKTGEK